MCMSAHDAQRSWVSWMSSAGTLHRFLGPLTVTIAAARKSSGRYELKMNRHGAADAVSPWSVVPAQSPIQIPPLQPWHLWLPSSLFCTTVIQQCPASPYHAKIRFIALCCISLRSCTCPIHSSCLFFLYLSFCILRDLHSPLLENNEKDLVTPVPQLCTGWSTKHQFKKHHSRTHLIILIAWMDDIFENKKTEV